MGLHTLFMEFFYVGISVLISTLVAESYALVDQKYEACKPRNCGSGPNISYPFYMSDTGTDFCGYPGFGVFCEDNKPFFTTSQSDYFIEDISYETQSFRLVNVEVINSTCTAPQHKFAFDRSSFKFTNNFADLILFYNCTKRVALSYPHSLVTCASIATNYSIAVLNTGYEDWNCTRLSEEMACETYVGAPVDWEESQYNQTREIMDYTELLMNGFSLRWTGINCHKCRSSGGRCGFDENNDAACFCPDGPRRKHCSNAEEERKHHPGCPPFDCSKLGRIGFPFNNETHPECGLCTVTRCTEETPHIQLETRGKSFAVKSISQANAIVIQDELLQEQFLMGRCEVINNWTNSGSPSISIQLAPDLTLLTMLKCSNIPNITGPITEYKYTSCCDSIIYYNHPDHTHIPLPPPPPNCSIIQYPVNIGLGITNLSALLISDTTLQIALLEPCRKCYFHRGGQCQTDEKGKFQCLNGKRGNNKGLKIGLGVGISSGCIILVILVICLFIIRRRYKGKNVSSTFLSRNTSSDPSSNSELERVKAYFGIPIFPYSELEEATNNFDTDKEIGDGGFGTVYYGQLRDGREVAVKRLYENNYKRVEQFMNEVKILTRLRHPNLVSLYGCTSRHSRELLLVYEFIPNGTVADHLHGDRAKSGLLTWPIRLSIAIETASALCYLHATDIVHRDVKTNNILLDNSFCVKVADFGLSRLFPTDVTHVSTAPQGTPGYVDPEYHQCYQLTEKSDVYSFGVVLIELVSSLPAVDISRHRHEINLSNYAMNKIQKHAFNELVDPCLGFSSDLTVNRMTILVAELAFRCLQPDKEMRPSMDEVLEILKEIESDKYVLEETDTVADSLGSTQRMPPPPPSPDCDEVRLLKNVQLMPSPDTVTAKWISRSTTPSTSA